MDSRVKQIYICMLHNYKKTLKDESNVLIGYNIDMSFIEAKKLLKTIKKDKAGLEE